MIAVDPNNGVKTPPKDSSDKYRVTYQTLFVKLSPPLQKRVLQLKENYKIRDPEAEAFIKEVISIAESDLPVPT